LSIYSDLVLTV